MQNLNIYTHIYVSIHETVTCHFITLTLYISFEFKYEFEFKSSLTGSKNSYICWNSMF